jgi:hypothetical protein
MLNATVSAGHFIPVRVVRPPSVGIHLVGVHYSQRTNGNLKHNNPREVELETASNSMTRMVAVCSLRLKDTKDWVVVVA